MLSQPQASRKSDQETAEAARRTAFPITKHEVFFGHAGVSPLPRLVAEKIQFAAHTAMNEGQHTPNIQPELNETRVLAARLINAQAKEIALLGPTALGLNLVALGLPWEAGDEVVYYPGDYPANVYPWLELARRGVKPVALAPKTLGHLTPEVVLAALTPKTKLVALATCHFLTGYRIDLEAIGALLHERGILFAVDGIQSLGATPVDVEKAHIDFLSSDSHKWLLGPRGAGIFYVRESRFPLLRPALVGSWNAACPNFVSQPTIAFPDTASRYECGTLNILGLLGMKAALEMALGAGVAAIHARLLELHAYGAEQLRKAGFTILSDAFPENAKSGILTVQKPGADLPALFEKLTQRKITVSLRWDSAGASYLRFSPHFYNTEAELDTMVAVLAEK